MVEHRQGEGLPLCVGAKVRLEAEWVDGWDESFDGVEGGAWNGGVLGHVTSEKWQKNTFLSLKLITKHFLRTFKINFVVF